MARTLQEIDLHISTQTLWVQDLDREALKRRAVIRDLWEERRRLLELPIGYVAAFTRPHAQSKHRRSLRPIPIYLRDHGQTHTLAKCGGHIAIVNQDGTLKVGVRWLLATLALGEAMISCGGVMIRYSRTFADAYSDTISLREIKAVL